MPWAIDRNNDDYIYRRKHASSDLSGIRWVFNCHPVWIINGFQGYFTSLLWGHNGRGSVSNHQLHDCLLNRLFRRRSKKTSKLRVTGLCAGNSPVTGEFPAQMASNAEKVSIWWRRHVEIWFASWQKYNIRCTEPRGVWRGKKEDIYDQCKGQRRRFSRKFVDCRMRLHDHDHGRSLVLCFDTNIYGELRVPFITLTRATRTCCVSALLHSPWSAVSPVTVQSRKSWETPPTHKAWNFQMAHFNRCLYSSETLDYNSPWPSKYTAIFCYIMLHCMFDRLGLIIISIVPWQKY